MLIIIFEILLLSQIISIKSLPLFIIFCFCAQPLLNNFFVASVAVSFSLLLFFAVKLSLIFSVVCCELNNVEKSKLSLPIIDVCEAKKK